MNFFVVVGLVVAEFVLEHFGPGVGDVEHEFAGFVGRDEFDGGKFLLEGLVARPVIGMPVGINDVGDGFVGEVADGVDFGPGGRWASKSVEDENVGVVDDDDGAAVRDVAVGWSDELVDVGGELDGLEGRSEGRLKWSED